MHHYCFNVIGKVQQVSYRRYVCANAQDHNYSGYVKNLSDGSVEVCASIADDDFASFIAILETGSPRSHVENITQTLIETAFTDGFEIR